VRAVTARAIFLGIAKAVPHSRRISAGKFLAW
jgi:hypothetical protein